MARKGRPVLANPVEDTLFDDEPAVMGGASHPAPMPTQQDYLRALTEQIIRDRWTLDNTPENELSPDRKFYEDRIASYQAAAKEIQK